MNERKKLYRSVTDRMLCGVCGGIADYFSIDPTLVRLALVALTFMGFSGIIVYIIAALIIPEEPAEHVKFFQKEPETALFIVFRAAVCYDRSNPAKGR